MNDLKVFSQSMKFSFFNEKIPTDLLFGPDIFPIGTDIGYGSLKVFSPYGYHISPSLLFKKDGFDFVLNQDTFSDNAIFYRKSNDEDEDVWYLGDIARDLQSTEESDISDERLFAKERTLTAEYLILFRATIALGLLKKDMTFETNKKIKVCTGLPHTRLDEYIDILYDKLCGQHMFQFKIGNNDWVDISFNLLEDDLLVISQPAGTLFSLSYDRFGRVTNADLLYDNRVLVVDGGFYTFDTYLSENLSEGKCDTTEQYSMYKVFEKTAKKVSAKVGRKISASSLAYYINRKVNPCIVYNNFKGSQYDFQRDFIMYKDKIADGFFEEFLAPIYHYFNDVQCVIVTGGTGKAFYPNFEKLIPSNTDLILSEKTDGEHDYDNYETVFSNVSGYYNFLVNNLAREMEIDIEKVLNDKEVKKNLDEAITEVAVSKENSN